MFVGGEGKVTILNRMIRIGCMEKIVVEIVSQPCGCLGKTTSNRGNNNAQAPGKVLGVSFQLERGYSVLSKGWRKNVKSCFRE